MKNFIVLSALILLYSLNGYSQTYDVVRIDLECEIHPLQNTGINSLDSDFAPFIVDEYIYFASNRNPDVLLAGENNWKKLQHINLYQAKIKGDIDQEMKTKGLRLVSEKFDYGEHTGPGCFSLSGDTLFLSQVRVDSKSGIFRPQLFYAVRYNNRFTKLKALPFNDPAYSLGHPFYDSNKNRLYFASDRPGGKGGKDIFYTDLTDTGWSKPAPLDMINTENDEMYPFIVDDIIFFASNRATDNGELNIHWKVMSTDQEVELLEGANSEQNDFGFFAFPGLSKGFVSSNRKGNDNIYFLDIERSVTVRREMSGELAYKTINGLPADITLQLVDENDFVLNETKTDENGRFLFKSVDHDGTYYIRALSEEDLELTLNNLNGEKTTSLFGDEDNYFVYRKVSGENNGTLSLIPENMMDFDLDQGHLTAQLIYQDKPGDYPADQKVSLINSAGNEARAAYTDDKGNFEFKELSLKENYLLKLPESEEDVILLIYDLKGNVVAELKTNQDGEFTYRNIHPDYSNQLELEEEDELAFEFENKTVWGYFEYENKTNISREGLIVKVYDANGKLIEQELTDENGTFRFRSLPIEKSLLFKLEENGENFILDDFTLYIFDRNGQKIAGLRRGQDGYFKYRPLGYEDDNTLSTIEEEFLDFILGDQRQRKHVLVYFDSNQSKVKSSDKKIIDNLYQVLKENPTIKIEINAYADARSSDEYNLILSQRRGDWIANYLAKKGIPKDRFIVNAYGESRLVDEENDALNRRAEIHLY